MKFPHGLGDAGRALRMRIDVPTSQLPMYVYTALHAAGAVAINRPRADRPILVSTLGVEARCSAPGSFGDIFNDAVS